MKRRIKVTVFFFTLASYLWPLSPQGMPLESTMAELTYISWYPPSQGVGSELNRAEQMPSSLVGVAAMPPQHILLYMLYTSRPPGDKKTLVSISAYNILCRSFNKMWVAQNVSHHAPLFGRVLSLAALFLYCLLLNTSGNPLNLET